MLTLNKIAVRMRTMTRLDISWSLTPSNEDPLDYEFTLQRGGSWGGPFDTLAGPFRDRYAYTDLDVSLFTPQHIYYYRLVITKIGTSETWTSDSVSNDFQDAPLDALEVRRLESLLFTSTIGRRCWLYPVKTFGKRCPVCYNVTLGKQVKSKCIACYDTSFIGGYHRPIEVWVHIPPIPNSVTPTQSMEIVRVTTTARLDSFPPVKPRDVLVESTGHRWRVLTQVPTERLRYPIHQELQMSSISPGDVEWELPMNPSDAIFLLPVDPKQLRPKSDLGPEETNAILRSYS